MTLKDISWQVPEEEYRADPALSYSTIARFYKEGFKGLPNLFDKIETPSLLFGSLVDTLVTDEEEFDNKYFVTDIPEVSEVLNNITYKLMLLYPNHKSMTTIPDEVLAKVGEECDFWKNDKFKNHRVKLIREGCTKLFEVLSSIKDKTVVSNNLYLEAKECRDELLFNDFTSFYFNDNPFDTQYERYYQLKFKGDFEGIPLRVMMDLVIVDTKNKIIVPIDLKTSSKPEYEFYKSYKEWLYGIQSNLYTHVLKQNIAKYEEFKDYRIGKYLFIVINRKYKKPLVWQDTTNHLEDDIKDKDGKIIAPNWRPLAKELHGYLSQPVLPAYPDWVGKVNSIHNKLNEK